VQGAVQLAADNSVSSLHVTFCTEGEARRRRSDGPDARASQQFHWFNDGYADFDAFLADLRSVRASARTSARNANARRPSAARSGLTGRRDPARALGCVLGVLPGHRRAEMGHALSDAAFFDIAQETLRDDMLLVLADARGLAGGGRAELHRARHAFGRYWGCIEDHPCLHFELCYYQAIDFAIAHGHGPASRPGAQGQHKLARGYLPVTTHSLHWVRDRALPRRSRSISRPSARPSIRRSRS
jgi:predicted N-acyltransferase